MAALKLYHDLMSQPSRALYIFIRTNKIPYTDKPVALRRGEHFGEEFTAINPFQKVPVLDDGGFVLTESVAELKYLCAKYPVAAHWYPADLQQRARVDEYLAWQHFNTRLNGAMVFRTKVMGGMKIFCAWLSSIPIAKMKAPFRSSVYDADYILQGLSR